MLILSHRGWWQTSQEKNTLAAFDRSFSAGFGTETDFRDLAGALVIAHDPPLHGALTAEAFFASYCNGPGKLPLALNVKSDGLQPLFVDLLQQFKIDNYFFFDMAIPDMIGYIKAGFRVFTRQSEYETLPALYEQAHGVWIDGFDGEWMDEAVLERHVRNGKQVCMVSPELHGRAHEAFWRRVATMPVAGEPGVMICTDYPARAKEVFHGEN